MVCKDGVIIATEKIINSKLQSRNADKRIFSIDSHISLAICGKVTDGMIVLEYAKKECEN